MIIVYSLIASLVLGLGAGVAVIMGLAAGATTSAGGAAVLGYLMIIGVALLPVIHIVGLFSGIGLLRGNPTAHRYALFCSVFYLLNFPFGTAVGAAYLYARSVAKKRADAI